MFGAFRFKEWRLGINISDFLKRFYNFIFLPLDNEMGLKSIILLIVFRLVKYLSNGVNSYINEQLHKRGIENQHLVVGSSMSSQCSCSSNYSPFVIRNNRGSLK
jgi:hypothetical protein